MYNISKHQQLRIAVNIVKSLKDISNKSFLYVSEESDELTRLIAKKSGIRIDYHRGEAGMVNIDEYITLTMDEHADRLERKQLKLPPRQINHSIIRFKPIEVGNKLHQLTREWEEKHIPSSGHSKSHIGEMLRAIRYIQYRAFNDGDMWYMVDSPTFMSFVYLVSQIDKLNYSRFSYNEETGEYSFDFTDNFLKENSWDGKISTTIEHSLAKDADFIKYQLIDLVSNGKITDKPNEYDSRDYKELKTERYY